MTKRSLLFCTLLALTLPAPYAFAQETDVVEPSSDSRIKLLPYDETDVYTVTTRYGYQTNVVFGRGEEIQTISVGDRSLWQLIPAGNRLFIRPMAEGVTTNMTILTNKHAYQFDLKSVADGKKDSSNIYVAKFTYPEDRPPVRHVMLAPPPPPEPVAAPVPEPAPVHSFAPRQPVTPLTAATPPAGLQPEHPNFNYTYTGPDALAPLQTYDNGSATFIEYVRLSDPPPQVFTVLPGGQKMPVASHVQDHTLVIDTVASELAVESEGGAIHLYNEMLSTK